MSDINKLYFTICNINIYNYYDSNYNYIYNKIAYTCYIIYMSPNKSTNVTFI